MERQHKNPPCHILICGERYAGKSTLIKRLLDHNTRPLYGYFTQSTAPDEIGFRDIYIFHAEDSECRQRPENQIGRCNSRIHDTHPEVFETLGVKFIKGQAGGVIVMDEIGFMETNSPLFCESVLRNLDGSIPVIAAVKARNDIPFLRQVRSHPHAALYNITPENRDTLFEKLLPVIVNWNKLL